MDLLTKLAEDPGFLDRALGFSKVGADSPAVSALQMGLRHGGIAAIPGAAIGAGLGYLRAPDEATTKQKLLGAGKGAIVGGTVAGLGVGGASAALQGGYNAIVADAVNHAKLHGKDELLEKNLPDVPKTWTGAVGTLSDPVATIEGGKSALKPGEKIDQWLKPVKERFAKKNAHKA